MIQLPEPIAAANATVIAAAIAWRKSKDEFHARMKRSLPGLGAIENFLTATEQELYRGVLSLEAVGEER